MKKGKKSIARRVVYGAFDLMGERANKDPVEMFEQAMTKISPRLEVKPRRVGGATYQVPIEVIARVENRSIVVGVFQSVVRQERSQMAPNLGS